MTEVDGPFSIKIDIANWTPAKVREAIHSKFQFEEKQMTGINFKELLDIAEKQVQERRDSGGKNQMDLVNLTGFAVLVWGYHDNQRAFLIALLSEDIRNRIPIQALVNTWEEGKAKKEAGEKCPELAFWGYCPTCKQSLF
jgi:hypothetical protein